MLVRLRSSLRYRAWRERGATSAEYALIAALIAVVIIGAVAFLGTNLAAMWSDSASQVSEAGSQP